VEQARVLRPLRPPGLYFPSSVISVFCDFRLLSPVFTPVRASQKYGLNADNYDLKLLYQEAPDVILPLLGPRERRIKRDHLWGAQGIVTMNDGKAYAPCRDQKGQRIEWTGAGGDYFLGIVVDREDRVAAEFWGTRQEVLSWIETQWPRVPAKYVPMVYSPRQRRLAPRDPYAPRKRKRRAALAQ
jgi:hypothetical protein